MSMEKKMLFEAIHTWAHKQHFYRHALWFPITSCILFTDMHYGFLLRVVFGLLVFDLGLWQYKPYTHGPTSTVSNPNVALLQKTKKKKEYSSLFLVTHTCRHYSRLHSLETHIYTVAL